MIQIKHFHFICLSVSGRYTFESQDNYFAYLTAEGNNFQKFAFLLRRCSSIARSSFKRSLVMVQLN